MALNQKQKRFAEEYVRTGNATEAARLAGYKQPHVQGTRLLENVSVKSYIDAQLEKMHTSTIMSAQQIMQRLSDIALGKLKETVVVATPAGAESVEKEADFKTQIIAMKELLKRYPADDGVLKAQLRKLEAEAEISEKKAAMFNSEDSNITISVTHFSEEL